MASGPDLNAKAFIYGHCTILVFDHAPTFLAVEDDHGQPVAFERIGKHYRLERQLQSFTAWPDGMKSTFEAVPIKQASSDSSGSKAVR